MAQMGGSEGLLCIDQPYLDLGPAEAHSQKAVTYWAIDIVTLRITEVLMSIRHLHRVNKC
jgi:hypothetical protein